MIPLSLDLDGDTYAETLAYDLDGDPSSEVVSIDTDLDGWTDLDLRDTSGDDVFDAVLTDSDRDGALDTIEAVPGAGGIAFTTPGGPDVSGASGANAAFHGLWAQMLGSGGTLQPSEAAEPYRFDSYERDSDGDGHVDALDPQPTTYD